MAAAAYAGMRLFGAWQGEPNPLAIGPSEHVPYFWRCILATWIGFAAGVTVAWFGPLPPLAAARARRCAPVVLFAAILAVLCVP